MDISTIINSFSSFNLISELIENNETTEIINTIARYININVNTLATFPMGGYSKGRTSGSYYYVLKDLKSNLCHYQWLYSMLSDERSKEVFLNLMQFKVLPDMNFIKKACDKDHDQYFDHKIVHCNKDEVFVDCGGFIGDTVESFIKNYKEYKKIYTYEPSKENIEKCRETLKEYKNISLKPFGVGKKEDTIFFTQSGSSSSFMADPNIDKEEVKITSLDVDIKEPVSFIKMDVEGSEIDAIIGAKRHIKNDHPKLAICVYHIISDIWEIPKLIYAVNPQYKFYIRHYREDQNWETVLYAIPK